MDAIVADVLDRAIAEVRSRGIAVYTFALYFDHESPALSVCVDTAANSARTVKGINAYNRKYFVDAVQAGDLRAASLWCSNVGRSLSLGDFALVNVARTELSTEASEDQSVFQAMLRVLVAREHEVAILAPDRDALLLCCTGPDDEAEYVWSVPD